MVSCSQSAAATSKTTSDTIPHRGRARGADNGEQGACHEERDRPEIDSGRRQHESACGERDPDRERQAPGDERMAEAVRASGEPGAGAADDPPDERRDRQQQGEQPIGLRVPRVIHLAAALSAHVAPVMDANTSDRTDRRPHERQDPSEQSRYSDGRSRHANPGHDAEKERANREDLPGQGPVDDSSRGGDVEVGAGAARPLSNVGAVQRVRGSPTMFSPVSRIVACERRSGVSRAV